MKTIRLSLIIGALILLGNSIGFATNPISENAYMEKEIEEKAKWRSSKFARTIKRWYAAAKEYTTGVMDRSRKFLLAWLGLAGASVILLVLSYVVLFAIPSEIGVILYFLMFLLAFLAGIASFVFFILWLVDYIQANDAGTRVPGPETGEITPREKKPERKKRKKRRN